MSRSGGMADAKDSKSFARKGVWVQVPPPVFQAIVRGEQVLVEEFERTPLEDDNEDGHAAMTFK